MKSRILIVGVNWLGDTIMCLPAVQSFQRANPDTEIVVAVKQKLADLWKMVPSVSDIIEIQDGPDGTIKTAKEIRQHSFDRAYIFPNSFRAALLPFMASVPRRIGMVGHTRSAMLTEITKPLSEEAGKRHQSWEYADILGLTPDPGFPGLPEFVLPPEAVSKAESLLPNKDAPVVALIPGAAFGDAKRWPAEYFCEVGLHAVKKHGAAVVVLGSPSETDICEQIADQIGAGARSVAGKTGLPEMMALLKKCRYAASNDCGGMHVAAAMGVKTVAIFGITDPSKTGPIGEGHRIVAAEGVQGSRDLDRDSGDAKSKLAAISPERVGRELDALMAQLDGNGQ